MDQTTTNRLISAIDNYEQENKDNMAFWFPLLKQIGMRVPKTILVDTGDCDLGPLTEGETPKNIGPFLKRLKEAITQIGLPCFLRSGMTSNKHDWKDSCFIECLDDQYLINHLYKIVEMSFIANIAGLPFDYSLWAVRELIPTKAVFYAFNKMPITKERRLFVNNGQVECNHPYWPNEAFEHQDLDIEANIKELHYISGEDKKELELMAKYVGRYFTGFWSMDFLQDVSGKWWLTDMAVGERSYHYPECEKGDKR